MWQDIFVYAVLAIASGVVIWRFYRKFTGKASCCGTSCSCSGSCDTAGDKSSCGCADDGLKLSPHSGKNPPKAD